MSSATAATSGLTETERFLFDLQGYVVLRKAIDATRVAAMNDVLSEKLEEGNNVRSRDNEVLKNTAADSVLRGEDGARVDIGGFVGWEGPGGDAFRSLLVDPVIGPKMEDLLGKGYRLDHQPLIIVQNPGSEGFSLHGGPINSEGELNTTLQYRSKGGKIWTSLLAVAVHLVDADEGAGGFAVVPGSHKLDIPPPPGFADGNSDAFEAAVTQPAVKAGDVVFFSEATIHGALPWRADHQRRLALFRFAPATNAYGRGYLESFGLDMDRPEFADNPALRAVLSPPFATRLDREVVDSFDQRSVCVVGGGRSSGKKDHDQAVFGTQYF